MSVPTPTELKPELGTPVADIETPAVVVDMDRMERNLERYATFADEHDVQLRSHVKTHKTPDIAHLEDRISDGGGIVCQTLGEVEVMAYSGLDDIYLSYMVVGDAKLDRFVRVANHVDRLVTTVDGPGNVEPLARVAAARDTRIEVVIEVDVGLNRTGVESPSEAAALAETVAETSHLDIAGVMAFEGNVEYDPETDSEAEFEARCHDAIDTVAASVEAIETVGHEVREVKVGSTPTSLYSGSHPVVTEINPGMYPFNDLHTVRATPALDRSDCALTVHTTVISKPAPDRAVVDAGSKSISLELDVQPEELDRPDLEYVNASEEHGWIDTTAWSGEPIEVGDRLAFIVPHVCPTINLHDSFVGVRDGTVEEVWSVQARGKVK